MALVHNKNHARSLIDAGYETREIDFQKLATLNKALKNIDTLVYVASKTYSVFDRVRELEKVLSAMQENHVANLVAMSFISLEDSAEAMGYLHGLNDDFSHLTGHEPESMEHFLARNYQTN
ncbi:NAD(P)H-binding protein [uncultured Lactobacillus sp.]|uniref:NAD(P)H-binding protein n=1 Tax=uncultured Lactobacillus sp. TaxID=153152 RepID=UPI00263955A6|nr:NAD(P)H-binding protein [uncultured Lactobacillus sp.]